MIIANYAMLSKKGHLAREPELTEIIVADSLSDDDTVAIAGQFPVRVVQLTRLEDRGCGTGAQLSPVTSVDHRKVGDGATGPVTQRLSRVYFDAVRAISDRYKEWVTPVYPA